jgi:hypothetical protein
MEIERMKNPKFGKIHNKIFIILFFFIKANKMQFLLGKFRGKIWLKI